MNPPQTLAASVVISEVLFDPAAGDAPFVELLNAGSAPVDLTGMALRLEGAYVSLVRVTAPLAPAGRVLIRFDGGGRMDGRTYHAPGQVTLNATGGTLEIVDDHNRLLDRVAWGTADGAVDGDQSLLDAPPQGRTIGRGPDANRPFAASDWTTFLPGDATPGTANPMPLIEDLLPDDGDATDRGTVDLMWRPAAGAVSYHYQVTRTDDSAFARVVAQGTITGLGTTLTPLPPARYIWRAQPVSKAAAAGRWSRTASFEISRPAGLDTFSRAEGLFALKMAARPRSQPAGPSVVLPVPLILQHKDTHMLQLENPREDDPHGWNRDHQVYDPDDPADLYNCVLASIAMINKSLGGNLSQDRIAYEVKSGHGASYAAAIISAPQMSGFAGRRNGTQIEALLHDQHPGPEWDLLYGDGLNPAQILAAMAFAFQSPGRLAIFKTGDEAWSAVKAEIDARRPVIVASGKSSTGANHAVVIKGYQVTGGQRFFVVNNPASGSWTRLVDASRDFTHDVYYFLPPNPAPRRQEPSVDIDSDGDRVYDFDEIERFHTDPHKLDTDGDGLDDYIDIVTGVFDPRYGYATHPLLTLGRDFNGNGIPTELDPDSDSGGCLDGVEDADSDGHRSGKETWNFDERDDLCGNINGHITFDTEYHFDLQGINAFRHDSLSIAVALKLRDPGQPGALIDSGRSRYWVTSAAQYAIPALGECAAISRGSYAGRGAFDKPSDSITGDVEADKLVIDADATSTGRTTTDWCLGHSDEAITSGASLPECVGHRIQNTQTYRFNCTTPPAAGTGGQFTRWSVQGTLRMENLRDPMRLWTGWMMNLRRPRG